MSMAQAILTIIALQMFPLRSLIKTKLKS